MRRIITRDSYKGIIYEVHCRKDSKEIQDLIDWRGPYSHTMYLKLVPERFRDMPLPEMIPDWNGLGKRCEYNSHPLSDLYWHGGCTYMDLKKDPESNTHIITVGCDYMHLGDEGWSYEDNTGKIEKHAHMVIEELLEKFERLPDEEWKLKLKELNK